MAGVARLALLVALVASSVAYDPHRLHPMVDNRKDKVTGKKIVQPLDHLETSDSRTWSQNYWVREDLYEQGGPVFLSVGADLPMEDWFMTNGGSWQRYAQEHHALMFQLEHRYYGMSRPTSDMSTDNLKYLTIEQSLADLANFIQQMNREHHLPSSTKWIVFGCSASASLATWLRGKHPDLVHGVVASSPIVNVKIDYPEYLEGVRNSLMTYGQDCVDAVQKAFLELDDLVKSPDGSVPIDVKVWVCGRMDTNNQKDVMTLNDRLVYDLMYVVQFNEYEPYGGTTFLQEFCGDMTDSSKGKTYLERFADTIRIYATAYECIKANYTKMVEALQKSEWGSYSHIERQNTYQLCTELGFSQTSDSENSFLGPRLPLKYYLDLCKDVFGDKFTEDYVRRSVARTGEEFGGLNQRATRVLRVHGSLDPWSTLALQETTPPESPLIMIPGATHCEDTRASQDSDSPALREARRNISSIIGQWLKTDGS